MWKPISTVLKSEYILIKEDNWLPDLVHWKDKELVRPEGWFTRAGARSTVLCPTHWMRIPR